MVPIPSWMQARFFEDEIKPHLKHKKRGLLCMAGRHGGWWVTAS